MITMMMLMTAMVKMVAVMNMMVHSFLHRRGRASLAINSKTLLILRGATVPCYRIKITIGGIQIIICIVSNSTANTRAAPLAFCGGPLCQAKPSVMFGIARQRKQLSVATYITS